MTAMAAIFAAIEAHARVFRKVNACTRTTGRVLGRSRRARSIDRIVHLSRMVPSFFYSSYLLLLPSMA